MKVYRVLAYLVAAGVAFQSATIAYAFFALGSWVEQGNALDKATDSFPGEGGLSAHGTGGIAVAVLALALLVASFFAHVPGGVKWAGITFGLVVLQFLLGLVSHDVPALGVLHGVNALAVFAVAVMAGMRVKRAVGTRVRTEAEVPTSVG
jgi:hypothetical protein